MLNKLVKALQIKSDARQLQVFLTIYTLWANKIRRGTFSMTATLIVKQYLCANIDHNQPNNIFRLKGKREGKAGWLKTFPVLLQGFNVASVWVSQKRALPE